VYTATGHVVFRKLIYGICLFNRSGLRYTKDSENLMRGLITLLGHDFDGVRQSVRLYIIIINCLVAGCEFSSALTVLLVSQAVSAMKRCIGAVPQATDDCLYAVSSMLRSAEQALSAGGLEPALKLSQGKLSLVSPFPPCLRAIADHGCRCAASQRLRSREHWHSSDRLTTSYVHAQICHCEFAY